MAAKEKPSKINSSYVYWRINSTRMVLFYSGAVSRNSRVMGIFIITYPKQFYGPTKIDMDDSLPFTLGRRLVSSKWAWELNIPSYAYSYRPAIILSPRAKMKTQGGSRKDNSRPISTEIQCLSYIKFAASVEQGAGNSEFHQRNFGGA